MERNSYTRDAVFLLVKYRLSYHWGPRIIQSTRMTWPGQSESWTHSITLTTRESPVTCIELKHSSYVLSLWPPSHVTYYVVSGHKIIYTFVSLSINSKIIQHTRLYTILTIRHRRYTWFSMCVHMLTQITTDFQTSFNKVKIYINK